MPRAVRSCKLNNMDKGCRARTCGLRLVLWAALLFPGNVAVGQRSQGLELYRQATRLFEAEKFREAIAVYKRSYTLHPHSNTLYAIGEAYRRIGELRASHEYYRRYAAGLPADKRAPFAAKLRRLKLGHPSELVVSTDPPGATVWIDGEVRGSTPPIGKLRLNIEAGEHTVRVHLKRHRRLSAVVVAEFGEPVSLTLKLEPRAPRINDPDPLTDERRGGWSLMASLLGGVSFASYGDAPLEVDPAAEGGLEVGALWLRPPLAVSLYFNALFVPAGDDLVSDSAAFVTLMGGVGGRGYLSPRLWIEVRFALGTAILVGAGSEHMLVLLPSPVERSYAGLAIRPAVGLGYTIWRGLSFTLFPFALTYSPRTGGFDLLAPDVTSITRYHVFAGLAWQIPL